MQIRITGRYTVNTELNRIDVTLEAASVSDALAITRRNLNRVFYHWQWIDEPQTTILEETVAAPRHAQIYIQPVLF